MAEDGTPLREEKFTSFYTFCPARCRSVISADSSVLCFGCDIYFSFPLGMVLDMIVVGREEKRRVKPRRLPILLPPAPFKCRRTRPPRTVLLEMTGR